MNTLTSIKNSRILCAATILVGSTCYVGNVQAAEYTGPAISFEQIYAHPADNDLKLNYARQQIAADDYLSAAGILEGMLFTQPNWDTARLLYAIVLFKLDDHQASMREFNLLEDRPLTAEQRGLADSYQKQASRPLADDQSKVKIYSQVEVGVRTDNNAGNALFETPFVTANQSANSVFANGHVGISAPLSRSERSIRFNMGLQGQTRRHDRFSDSDYDVLSGSIGFSGDMGGMDWRADLKSDNVYISGDKYLTQMGPKLTVGTKISDTTRISLTGAAYYQDYEDTSFSSSERFRSGGKYLISAALFSRPSDSLTYGGSIGYESKIATTQSLRYTGVRLRAHIRNEFESGLYATANASLRILDYKALNFFVTPAAERDDTHFNARAGLGASLKTTKRWLGMSGGPSFDRISWEAALNYKDVSSNINVFEYDNIGAEMKLIWKY